MSIDALLTLRENVEKALSGRAKELQDQLSRLGRASGFRNRGRGSSLKGQKVPIKYRDRSGNTWAGRGAQPVWLREKLKGQRDRDLCEGCGPSGGIDFLSDRRSK